MALRVRIGRREVVGSGEVVIGPDDQELTFDLDGSMCVLKLTPTEEPGPFTVRLERRDPNHIEVDTRGRFPAGMVAWTYQNLMTLNGRDVDLDLLVTSETAQLNSVRRLSYTFTQRDAQTPRGLDPTAPGPAPSYTPPPIVVRQP